jgi:hypothetical protein
MILYLFPEDGTEPFEYGVVASVVLADRRGKFISNIQFGQIIIIVLQFHPHFRLK